MGITWFSAGNPESKPKRIWDKKASKKENGGSSVIRGGEQKGIQPSGNGQKMNAKVNQLTIEDEERDTQRNNLGGRAEKNTYVPPVIEPRQQMAKPDPGKGGSFFHR